MDEQRRSNEGLLSALDEALKKEDSLVASILTMLIEVEERRLHLALAYSSMFDFCRRRLQLSESEAFLRITAARLAHRFPQLLDALRTRRIHLSTIVMLRKLFTAENVDELIALTTGKSKRDVERIIAKLAPRPDVPASIRKLPQRAQPPSRVDTSKRELDPAPVLMLALPSSPSMTPRSSGHAPSTRTSVETSLGPWVGRGRAGDARTSAPGDGSPKSEGTTPFAAGVADAEVEAPALAMPDSAHAPRAVGRSVPARHQVAALSESRHRVQFTASSALREKLERARSLMRHRNIDGDLAVVVERALDVLITTLEKRKFATTSRPRPSLRADAHRTSARHDVPVASAKLETDTSAPASVPATVPPGAKVATVQQEQPHPRAASEEAGSRIVGASGESFEPSARRAVPAATRRAVVERDGEQCAFVSAAGVRCEQREHLEYDHHHPRARGGDDTTSNVRLLCRNHNAYEGERILGRNVMTRGKARAEHERKTAPPPRPKRR